MCIEQRIAKQQSDNKRKAKYEMGNICEQYGILPMAPSQRNHVKHKREKYDKRKFQKKSKDLPSNEYYNKNKRFAKKSNKHYKKHDNKKFEKKKKKFQM